MTSSCLAANMIVSGARSQGVACVVEGIIMMIDD